MATQSAQEIIQLALDQTHTKSSMVSSANLVNYFNIIRKRIGYVIMQKIGEHDYFDIWQTDAAVNNNGEYVLPTDDSTHAGIFKVLGVFVKPRYDYDVWIKAKEISVPGLNYSFDYYLTNQPPSLPVYFLADGSVFIAPQFTSSTLGTNPTNGMIKIYGVKSLIDLDLTATESDILIEDDYTDLIALGMEQYIYKARGMGQESLVSKQEFKDALYDLLIDIKSDFDQSEMSATLPFDNNLQIPR